MEQYQIDDMMSNLQNYLESNGINTQRLFRCINPDHVDSNASMKYFDDNKVYCFGCGASYNLVDCISILEGLDNKSAFKKAIDYYGTKVDKVKSSKIEKFSKNSEKNAKNYEKAYIFWKNNLKNNKNAISYLQKRGIDKATAERFNLGFNTFDFKKFKLNAVVIPINENCFTARNIVDDENTMRYYKPRDSHIALFNQKALTNEKSYCVITEGEFDCLSFETVGVNAMALGSANNTNKFVSAEKDINKTYILALDNDTAGFDATATLIDFFDDNHINYQIFDNCGFKDANKALTEDKETFEKAIKNLIENLNSQEHRESKKCDFEM